MSFKARGGAIIVATHSFDAGVGVADRVAILAERASRPRPPRGRSGSRRSPAALRRAGHGPGNGLVSAYLRRAWIVVWKDVLSERRSKESLNALLFFSLLLLFVFQFALGPERARVEAALPGLLWLGFILAGLLAFGRTFLAERENDCWEGLVLTPGDKSAIYLGKLAGNVLLMVVVEAVLLVLFAVFFALDFTGALPALVARAGPRHARARRGRHPLRRHHRAAARARAALPRPAAARGGAGAAGFGERDSGGAVRLSHSATRRRGSSCSPRPISSTSWWACSRSSSCWKAEWASARSAGSPYSPSSPASGAAFGYAPREAVQGNVQRIMYLHVPAVLTAYLAFGLVFLGSVGYLLTRRPGWDRLAMAAAEPGVSSPASPSPRARSGASPRGERGGRGTPGSPRRPCSSSFTSDIFCSAA